MNEVRARALEQRVRELIRDIPDFPVEGVMFKDITPLLADAEVLNEVIEVLADRYRDEQIDAVVGVESRGFIFAAPLAMRLGAAFIPARKPGKLPYDVLREDYQLEYGQAALEIHRDAIQPGQRVLVVDDLLATGGTSNAACRLVERLGGEVIGLCYVVELTFLGGREKLAGYRVDSLVQF